MATAAYAGIDVAIAKGKRLPVVVCTIRDAAVVPLLLRKAKVKPPLGCGNVGALKPRVVAQFADDTAAYLRAVETEFGVSIQRIAIDAPSKPKTEGAYRRKCELELDRAGISCITTPSSSEFEGIIKKAGSHLDVGGAENRLPGANQLWMLVGFALFQRLAPDWECLEVFPQALVALLGANALHKSQAEGALAQLKAATAHTKWPAEPRLEELKSIAFGSRDDKLDAYLSSWVASLAESERTCYGQPPNDAIWLPDLTRVPNRRLDLSRSARRSGTGR
jgi:hypothetical protein